MRGVGETLFEKHFFRFNRSKKLGQFRRSHRELLGMTLPDSSEFLACEPDLLLGPAAKYRVVLRVAFGPLALHEYVGGAGVERIVTHGDQRLLTFRVAKTLGPIVEVVDLDSFARKLRWTRGRPGQ